MAKKKQAQVEETPPKTLFLGEPMNEMDEEEVDEMLSDPDEFDIFVDIGDKLTKAGDGIAYSIKKDGQFIAGAIKHPFIYKGQRGWDAVRTKFGGGTFQVIARSTAKGGFIKSEARNVAEPEYVEEEEKPATTNPFELLSFMEAQRKVDKEEQREREEQKERERREEKLRLEAEAKEKMEEMKNSGNQTMAMMMAMMKSQSEQTTALLTAMMSGKKEEPLKVEKLIEMMDARTEKIIDRLTAREKSTNKDISPLELIKMQAEAEDRGYRKAKEIQELADEKAEEIAEMRESGNKEEKPSQVMKVVESLVPAIQSMVAGRLGGMPPMPEAPQAHAPALPKPPMPKRVLMPMGSPQRPLNQPLNQPKPVKKEPSEMDKKELIANTVIQDIGKDLAANLLTQKFDPEGTADKSLAVLSKYGVTPESLCSQYSLEDMMVVAKAKGMPDAIRPYIERFHAHIKAKATVGTGKSTTDTEQPNP